MATPLLITRADFAGRVEIPANMQDAKIDNRILEAEDFDLRELMGDAFYWSFIRDSQLSTVPPAITLLLSGGDYTIGTVTYTFYGLNPVLVYYTAGRLIKNLDIHITPNAMMQKRSEYSDHLDSKEIGYKANQYNNQALAYWHMCEKFLDANKTDYPLWKANCGCESDKVTPSARVTGLSGDDYSEQFRTVGFYGRR